MDTIFALSSGAPPAGIAVVRISGPGASGALQEVAGSLPEPRRARLSHLRDETGALLDQGLVLWFPGPNTATGEDLAELHLHGGRAVVAAVEAALARRAGLRRAKPGEFTRRSFANGRIDLAEAEGLADLLEAETELQRTVALAAAGGILSRKVEAWRDRVLMASAEVEAVLDFADEDDATLSEDFSAKISSLCAEIRQVLNAPTTEALREGFRVALAGPPNAGKSTLFNALVGTEAAIATPLPGTTRDVLERPVAIDGIPFTFVDMAGLRAESSDAVERIGIARAEDAIARADLVLWLGSEDQGPPQAWEIEPRVDRPDRVHKSHPRHRISAVTGEGLDVLQADLVAHARSALAKPGSVTVNQRQRALLKSAVDALQVVSDLGNPLILAENLRLARLAFDGLIGRSATEDMLDVLFGRFCIGK